MEAREVSCAACGAVYVFTRHPRYHWGKGGSLLCCEGCHTFFPLPYESGRWSKRLIRQDQPPPEGLRRREARLLSLLLLLLCGFFTGCIPGAIAYPKRGWGDWLVVAILIAFVAVGWVMTFAVWCGSLRLYRERR